MCLPVSRSLAVVLALAVASAGCAAAAHAARLEGRISAGQGIAAPGLLSVAIDDWVCGKAGSIADPRLVIGAERGLADVVLTVEVEDAPAMAAEGPVQIDQKGCVFRPHVTVLAPGQTLVVRNDDSVLHNFRTVTERNRRINRAQIKGGVDAFRFENPEIMHAECDVHYWMSAVVVVAEHAFVAVTDGTGRFGLDGLEPGRYPVRLWHQRLGERRAEVEVTADGGRLDLVWEAAATRP